MQSIHTFINTCIFHITKNNFYIFLILFNIEIQLLNTDCRGMMQAWLGDCAMVDLRIEFLQKLRTRLKSHEGMFAHLEKTENYSWYSKCTTFKVQGTYIQYFFDVVRNKIQTITIYTRVNKKKIKSSRKEHVMRTCFKF